ncbi:MAG: ATP-binding protein [Nitrospiraceae bacterium]|nr:MAG: ATP-binding protein [Nitrospiraceae bacterium]
MQDLSLHILDIAENSINANATEVRIKISEDTGKNLLRIEISDNGRGMDEETLKEVYDPFFTTKCKRTGLGIPLLAQSARECNGDLTIKTGPGKGTSISAAFQYDHIDRKPLGDICETMIVLIASNPDVDFIYEHSRDDDSYALNTADIKKELEGVPITSPGIIKIIKDDISEWLLNKDDMIK